MVLRVLLITFLLLQSNPGMAFEVRSHKQINEWIATHTIDGFSFNAALRNQLGFGKDLDKVTFRDKSVFEWISDGADFEDNGIRFFHHFHNPLQPWDRSGFKGLFSSSPLWAQTPKEKGVKTPKEKGVTKEKGQVYRIDVSDGVVLRSRLQWRPRWRDRCGCNTRGRCIT